MIGSTNLLFIADIVGEPGLQITEKLLPGLMKKYNVDFCIVNGENVTEGKGINDQDLATLINLRVDVITSGNHIWDTFKSVNTLKKDNRILRPANYPKGNPGIGHKVIENSKGIKLGVLNLQGRIFMTPIDNPFAVALEKIQILKKQTNLIFIDFHAEATAEKITMGWYLDGKVSAVVGTHTHVQTADERIFPQGTAFITDAGMTGAIDSVIGMKKEVALHRFMYSTNQKYQVAKENLHFCGVVITIDNETGKSVSIERINLP
ncbi:MAG TPA: TIGR00282 family metallophosphoesterase [Bacteroidetes bacterium]|nr:TIGR00282 family metallophosphoesterase [Bacteroidota bacterium]